MSTGGRIAVTEPAYMRITEELFADKVEKSRGMLEACCVCPRNCGINRLENETGFCGIGALAMMSSANPHFGEESPLVGWSGSGTIFFTSCNLKCIFCQNYEISHLMEGREIDFANLGDLMLRLQQIGCHNINFVTPTHVVPQILEAVQWAAARGLRIPLVYNSGGYDSIETLRLLDGVVDIYMPDIKFMDSKVSQAMTDAEDYPDVVKAAIREMHRQVGDLLIDERGIATKGLLVRHLVMPNDLAGTREAMRFLAREISTNTYVNVMNQYRPCGRAWEHPSLGRSISREEYRHALEAAQEEGITRLDQRVGFRLRSM
jgi:putative pyruvate formate lyase activating enzyme